MILTNVAILWLGAFLQSVNNASAFSSSSSSSLHSSTQHEVSTTTRLGVRDDTSTDVAVSNDDTSNTSTCGEGFYPVQGKDGEVCVFDYEAAASSFGIATKEQEFVCDANDYWKELEERNQVRRKFGMAPLTPEQFVVLQAQIADMEVKGQAKLTVAKDKREKEESDALLEKNSNSNSNVMKDFFGLFEDTCESNYDCSRPEVCCDFGFQRRCCDGGKTAKSLYGEYALIPVPQSSE
ncbi:hypothetical protein QTG54_016483 [Skeletonema marinoi]|uniref:Uncharacterized protein n=1 Tax=Skeletonema marinoi TaxID=267567 RepID=A0AAD8XS09_9STRA|nr:hypothetical protein QTG54_016483 [Skeletonema marinoi]